MRGGSVTTDGVTDPQIIENNWDNEGKPLFVYDGSTLDPFGEIPDFHLQEKSPCIDKGGFLTTITSASGSGTQFTIEDAWYFQDGFSGVIEGDIIQLENQSQRVKITNVDYTTNTITVETSVTWINGTGVSLAYEGSAPDIGAYEFGLATSSPKKNDNAGLWIQSCPNPLNNISTIEYYLPEASNVCIALYDINGQKVKIIVNSSQNTGTHRAILNAHDLPAGIYYCKLDACKSIVTKKCIIMR